MEPGVDYQDTRRTISTVKAAIVTWAQEAKAHYGSQLRLLSSSMQPKPTPLGAAANATSCPTPTTEAPTEQHQKRPPRTTTGKPAAAARPLCRQPGCNKDAAHPTSQQCGKGTKALCGPHKWLQRRDDV